MKLVLYVVIELDRWLIPTVTHAAAPWHFLYFLPLPHGHGSLRPTFGSSRRTVLTARIVAADARRLLRRAARDGAACDGAPRGAAERRRRLGRRIVQDERRCGRGAGRGAGASPSSLRTGRSHQR